MPDNWFGQFCDLFYSFQDIFTYSFSFNLIFEITWWDGWDSLFYTWENQIITNLSFEYPKRDMYRESFGFQASVFQNTIHFIVVYYIFSTNIC